MTLSREIESNIPVTSETIKQYFDNFRGFKQYRERQFVLSFEKKFSEYIFKAEDGYGVAVNSCNSALKLALIALGVQAGDEVIIPAFSFVSSLNTVLELNAKPVFVDIRIETCGLDHDCIEQKITERTKAIMVVHLYGIPTQMGKIKTISEKYGIPIIEDCAQALGSKLDGKLVGTFSHLACFSFNYAKPLSSEEGGIVIGKDKSLIERIRLLINNGLDFDTGKPIVTGFSYRMTDLQAMMLLYQMDNIDVILENRKQIAKKIYEIMPDKIFLKFNHDDIAYYMYPFFLKQNISEEKFQLAKRIIPFSGLPYFGKKDVPLPYFYDKCSSMKTRYPNAEWLAYKAVKFQIREIEDIGKMQEVKSLLDEIG